MSRKTVVPIVFGERHGIEQINDVLWVVSMCCAEKLEYLNRKHEARCVCRATYSAAVKDDGTLLGPFISVDEDNGENITRWAAAWLGAPVMVSLA